MRWWFQGTGLRNGTVCEDGDVSIHFCVLGRSLRGCMLSALKFYPRRRDGDASGANYGYDFSDRSDNPRHIKQYPWGKFENYGQRKRRVGIFRLPYEKWNVILFRSFKARFLFKGYVIRC